MIKNIMNYFRMLYWTYNNPLGDINFGYDIRAEDEQDSNTIRVGEVQPTDEEARQTPSHKS